MRSHAKHKAEARARRAATTLAGQDIGALPPIRDPERRERAHADFRFFCEAYFPTLFSLAWSDDHLRVISLIERTVIHSETFAVAMPRGSGKTTLCLAAVIWAVLEGYHEFVFLIASAEKGAEEAVDNIKAILSSNEELLADYPEAIYPIRALEGESRRCQGQRFYGVRTQIGWNANEIIMPTIPGSRCSGAVLRVAGLTGNIRGAVYAKPDGRMIRPTIAIVDDPQTDQSARSPAQVRQRLGIINGAVAGLAGPGKKIARIVPCTVIEEHDVADTLLDRERNPEWQGERTKLVYSFPINEALWDEYAKLRDHSFRNGGRGEQATEFYREHRAAMDEGAVVAWNDRKNPGELSAVQNAMNLKLRDLAAFFAEYQNQPIPAISRGHQQIDADDVKAKTNGLRRGEVPAAAHKLTAFIDVQGSLLYYMVAGWEEGFSGSVIDYGSYPDQGRAYFTLADAKRTLADAHPKMGPEAVIFAGLEAMADQLLSREWTRDDGTPGKIERLIIDANYQTDVVKRFCRQSKHAAILTPSHGHFIGATSLPFDQYKRKPGERLGHHWWFPVATGPVRHLLIDVNYWKTFLASRLSVAMGDPGCLSLFGGWDHQMIADHVTAEYGVEVTAKGRTVIEWKKKPGHQDNHLLDCFVGCCVGASMQGVALTGMAGAGGGTLPKKKRTPREAVYFE